MIRDQRHMSGAGVLATPEQVSDFWQSLSDERAFRGFPRWPMAPGRQEMVDSGQHVIAYISESRWVAECLGGPTGDCRGGMACWPDNPAACCLDCGTLYQVDFPDEGELMAGTQALLARPTGNRHWLRHQGESAADLQAENHAYGIGLRPRHNWKDDVAEQIGIPRSVVDQVERELNRRNAAAAKAKGARKKDAGT